MEFEYERLELPEQIGPTDKYTARISVMQVLTVIVMHDQAHRMTKWFPGNTSFTVHPGAVSRLFYVVSQRAFVGIIV